MTPTAGRIVLVKTSETEVRPAIVTEVHGETCVNLFVFNERDMGYKNSVCQGDEIGNWQWPMIGPVTISADAKPETDELTSLMGRPVVSMPEDVAAKGEGDIVFGKPE